MTEPPARPKERDAGCAGLAFMAALIAPFPVAFTSLETIIDSKRATAFPTARIALGLGIALAAGLLATWRLARADEREPRRERARAALRDRRDGQLFLTLVLVGTQLFALAAVAIGWARVQLPPPLGGKGAATWVAAIGGAAAVVIAWGALVRWLLVRRRDPSLVSPLARFRIHELRAAGTRLRAIAEALDEEGLAAPGGRWTGALLRAIVREVPRRPPPAEADGGSRPAARDSAPASDPAPRRDERPGVGRNDDLTPR